MDQFTWRLLTAMFLLLTAAVLGLFCMKFWQSPNHIQDTLLSLFLGKSRELTALFT